MQRYNKTTKDSVENERKKGRQDEVHKYGTAVTENIETAQQAKDDEQSTANENGMARTSERIEPEDEHSKGDMKYQFDKLNEEEHKQVYEGKRKIYKTPATPKNYPFASHTFKVRYNCSFTSMARLSQWRILNCIFHSSIFY